MTDFVSLCRIERVAKMIVDLVNEHSPVHCKRCGGTGRIDEQAGDWKQTSSLVGTCPDCGGEGEMLPGQKPWVRA